MFKNRKEALDWLKKNHGVIWDENSIDGKYSVMIPVDGGDTVTTNGETEVEAVEKARKEIEG